MRTFLKHVLLWLAIFVGYTYMAAYYDDYETALVANLMNVPLFMIAYYLLRYVQIPYLYDKGKMFAFGLSFLASSVLLSMICRTIGILWLDEFFDKSSDEIPFFSLAAYLLKTGRFYFPALVLLAWESHQERRKEQDRIQQLEKEKIATELKFLKAQINPHFLFNTLNNLYSYVVTQSPKAPDMIMRLSGILDYVLYKSQKKIVPLRDEIETIENFLELEKIRYGARLEVSFKTAGNMSLSISPLILLSVVENAFKHGASGDIDQPKINITIKEENDTIQCEVWNTKSQDQGELNDAYKEGIGLGNIQRQLNLVYPEQHQILIEDCADTFSVSITIKPTHE